MKLIQIGYFRWRCKMRSELFPKIEWTTEFETTYDAFNARLVKYGLGDDTFPAVLFNKFLFEMARTIPGEGFIVELGTEYGCSTCFLAGGSKAAGREQVITIDGDLGSEEVFCMKTLRTAFMTFWGRAPMRQSRLQLNLILAGVYDWVITMGCTTDVAAILLDIPIRILFVDAGHSYEDCTMDIKNWQDKLIKGGLLICHDYDLPAVARVVRELVIETGLYSSLQMVPNGLSNTVFAYKL